MKHLLFAAVLICASACGSSSPAPSAPEPTPASSPEPAAPADPAPAADPDVTPEPDAPEAEPEELALTALPAPPLDRFMADGVSEPSGRAPKLVQVSVKRNEIIDEERWFAENELTNPVSYFPRDDPATPRLRGVPLSQRIEGELTLWLFGTYNLFDSFLVATEPGDDDSVRFAFDLSDFSPVPATAELETEALNMQLAWAVVDGDRLYLCHDHGTYADSSDGVNAFLTAVSIPDGELLWRSRTLVSNARNFALVEAGGRKLLVAGYGFTDEPDFLHLVDPDSGAVLAKKKLRKGATYILPKDDKLYVRTYDRDYVFRIKP